MHAFIFGGNMKNIIVDGHSHFGNDYEHGEVKINGYVNFAKEIGVNIGLLMPVPVPVTIVDGVPKRCLEWKLVDRKIHYNCCNNPYQYINYKGYEEVQKLSDEELQLLFVPLVHPVLDDINYLEKMVEELKPVALKLHGMWTGFVVNDIPKEFITFIKDHQIPIITHCHYDNRPVGLGPDKYLVNGNSPYNWATFFNDNQIYGVINHGARLDFSTLNIANNSQYIKIAIGPDYIIDKVYRWLSCPQDYVEMKGYLNIIKENLKGNKIIFDIDYNWNTLYPKSDYDYKCIERTKEVWEEESGLVLGQNLIEHFPGLQKTIVKDGGVK